ncbi:GNAT family acetyltransferase [Lacticaseibacillus absianus]|uniref:GNAT family acetyltransferase n=1 Tax=Lacticaseibacillus absianus TaxID=2729623 RepID=UPI0015CC385B|nr:GNAT family acetyltransferase [Lacticaseibacillus absianus]
MAVDLVPLNAILQKYPEEQVRESLSSFVSVNEDVQCFLRDRCIQFEKVASARTTLIFSSYQGKRVLVGYFAISSKPLTISKKNWKGLSTNVRRKLMPLGYRTEQENYAVSSILLGQLGLNFQFHGAHLLSGAELLAAAYEAIKAANEVIGGLILYVEVDNEPHLRDFYTRNGFSQLIVKTSSETGDGQMRPYLTVNQQHLYIKKIRDI